jgi:hypothetical protein
VPGNQEAGKGSREGDAGSLGTAPILPLPSSLLNVFFSPCPILSFSHCRRILRHFCRTFDQILAHSSTRLPRLSYGIASSTYYVVCRYKFVLRQQHRWMSSFALAPLLSYIACFNSLSVERSLFLPSQRNKNRVCPLSIPGHPLLTPFSYFFFSLYFSF